jgi:subtilase family serine protease
VNRKFLFSGLAAGALALGSLAAVLPGASASTTQSSSGNHAVRVCAAHPKPGYASCHALAIADASGKIVQASQPIAAAFTPSDVQKAYNLKGLKSGGRTVAIVDAFAYPTLEADLAAYRDFYKLPKCTTKNGCLTVIGQDGGKPPSQVDSGWDLEQALDLDMVSAACPDCKILMVESDTNTFKNLGAAVNQAAKTKGVVAISNSYGADGFDGKNKSAYDHPGIAITASTGDHGYQDASAPASFTSVIAVGGTSIVPDGSSRGYNETVWSGAGSGCSDKNKPAKYQDTKATKCKGDAMADVSGPANPGAGGLSIYFTGHFTTVGGTSESSPMIAAIFGLSGKTQGYPGSYIWDNPKKLYDITSGSNGSCGAPLCTAGKGWDGPTGLGTPNGAGAF